MFAWLRLPYNSMTTNKKPLLSQLVKDHDPGGSPSYSKMLPKKRMKTPALFNQTLTEGMMSFSQNPVLLP